MRFVILPVLLMFAAGNLQAAGEPDETSADIKKPVSFWYLWGGAEGEYIESMIQDFNSVQNSFTVQGRSVPDPQKILLALAAGDGPDLTDSFSSLTASYAARNIMEPLDTYILRDGYDLTDFMPAALKSVSVEGTLFALPVSVNLMMLYFNRDLLESGGYEEPPVTDIELVESAIKLTRMDQDGHMAVQGFPDFPELYYIEHMTYALGGDFGAPGNLSPDNSGSRRALEMIVEFREAFGLDEVLMFNSESVYMTADDPFINGRQVFRIDGPWFGNHITNVIGSDLNYGVVPIPCRADYPDSTGSGQVQSSTFFIPSAAIEKEGAWAFISWLHESRQMAELSALMGWIPARISALDSEVLEKVLNFDVFAALARSSKLKTFPVFERQKEYQKIISSAFQKVMRLEESIDNALSAAAEESGSLY